MTSNGYTSFESMNGDQKEQDPRPPASGHRGGARPGTMRAIVFTEYGAVKDVVRERRVRIPSITKGDQVLVKVLYAALNPVDYYVVNGRYGALAPRKPHSVTGCDFCGRVVAKGDGDSVRFLEIGELVFGQIFEGNGSFAEYAVCPVANLSKVPPSLSPMKAAPMALSSQASYQALKSMNLYKESKLLILGGSTSAGIAAIQMAKKHIGCEEVIVTSSREELCMELGATTVVNYKEEDWAEKLKNYGVDAIMDCVGGEKSWDLCRRNRVLKENGRYVTLVGDEVGAKVDFAFIASVFGKVISRKLSAALGHPSWEYLMMDPAQNIDDVAALIRDIELKQVFDEESPFEFGDWRRMFEKAQNNESRGKLVIKMPEEGDDADTEQEAAAKVVDSDPAPEDDAKEKEEPADSAPDDEAKVEEEAVAAAESAPTEDNADEQEVVADANEAEDVAANGGAEEAAAGDEEAAGTEDAEEVATESKEEPAADDKAEPAAEDEAKPAAEDEAEPAAEDNAEPAAEDQEEPAAENKAEPAAEDQEDAAAGDKKEAAAEEEAAGK